MKRRSSVLCRDYRTILVCVQISIGYDEGFLGPKVVLLREVACILAALLSLVCLHYICSVAMSPQSNVTSLGVLLFKLNHYLRYGYLRYAVRTIPEEKDLTTVDTKLLRHYEVTFHRTTRARRAAQGLANVMYLRWDHTIVLLATEGTHPAFDTIVSYDVRKKPLYWAHYSVGFQQGKPHIILAPQHWKARKRRCQRYALGDREVLYRYFHALSPFSFAGIQHQKYKLYCEVNRRRKTAGLPRLVWERVRSA